MKKLFASIFLVVISTSAFAQQEEPLTAEILNVQTIFPVSVDTQLLVADCNLPHMPCHQPATRVSLNFQLTGCIADLGDVQHLVQRLDNGEVVIHVAAQSIVYEASMRVRCIMMPTKTVTLDIPGMLNADDIQVRNLSVIEANL